jgi:hypothetical protein
MVGNRDLEILASSDFRYVSRSGGDQLLEIAIGRPRQLSSGEWECPVALHGHLSDWKYIRGEDGIQSLSLALNFIHRILLSMVAQGGRILYAGSSDEVPLDMYFGGDGSKE